MITYEQIQKANEGLSTINMKDKPYVMVPQRVKAFRKLFPEGFITTELLSNENGICVMKTEVGYYDGAQKVILSSGYAYEKEANGYVNKTSYIENCETSSVGRALGFLALGVDGGGICSAEELVNAINNQGSQQGRPKANPAGTTMVVNAPADLAKLRQMLDETIKLKTACMDRAGKVKFLNEVVQPTLEGERNWKLCDDTVLLQKLLFTLQSAA